LLLSIVSAVVSVALGLTGLMWLRKFKGYGKPGASTVFEP
jgi:hypothetical protein